MHDEREVVPGADLLVEVAQQRQEGLVDVLVALPEGMVFEPPDDDTDADGDNVPDCFDTCPNDLNKLEPGICGCGNLDEDADGEACETGFRAPEAILRRFAVETSFCDDRALALAHVDVAVGVWNA